MTKDQEIIIQTAQAGGQILKKYFRQNLQLSQKTTPADFFTKADIESEKIILKILKKHFPNYNILAEESGSIDNNSEYEFVIDPLDGSNNYVLGIPNYSVAIALTKNNQTIFSVIYDPTLNKTYYAIKGQGAFCGGQRLTANKITDIKKSSISFVNSYATSSKTFMTSYTKLKNLRSKRVLDNWSVALDFALIALGKIEAMVCQDAEVYDYLAGKLIATEAGAKITDFKGRPISDEKINKFIVSNNRKILKELVRIL